MLFLREKWQEKLTRESPDIETVPEETKYADVNGWELHLHQSLRSKWIGWEESHTLGELDVVALVFLSLQGPR